MYCLELQDILYLIRCFKDPADNFIRNFVSFVHLNTRSISRNKLLINFSKTSHSQQFYFNRVAILWNSLPPLDLSLSFDTLNLHLKQVFWKHFTVHFIRTNLYSFHTVCFTFSSYMYFCCLSIIIISFSSTCFGCFSFSTAPPVVIYFVLSRILPYHLAGTLESLWMMNYELKVRNSFNCALILLYAQIITCINLSEIEDIADREFDELLQQVHFGELYVYSRLACKWTNGHVGGTVGRRFGSSGCVKYVRYAVGGVKNSVPFVDAPTYGRMGVEFAFIDSSINYSLIRTNFLSLLPTGVRISEDQL